NVAELPRIADLVAEVGGKMWSLFFLVVTGRALQGDDLSGEEYEKVFEVLYEIAKTSPFDVKTTEGMHYRRYVARREKQHGDGSQSGQNTRKVMWRTAGVSDGKGFVFVSHRGDIYPSGFLPIKAGNILQDSLVDVYRDSSLFRLLRDPDQRQGKCGWCEYRRLCGGSRSRAYALTGDYLAEDPRCTYQPSPRT